MSYIIYTVEHKVYLWFKDNTGVGKNSVEAKENRMGLHF